jgi:hypothetical protein
MAEMHENRESRPEPQQGPTGQSRQGGEQGQGREQQRQGREQPQGREQGQGRELAQSQREGRVARAIENRTARLPSDMFLWAGIASLAYAGFCQMREYRYKRQMGLFVGQLAAPLLLMGLYNKIVKVAGSDRATRP